MADAPRELLADALSNFLTPEQLTRLIDEVLAIDKKAKAEITCKHCHRKQYHYIDIPDAKAVALALPDLLNQAFGRVTEASTAQDPIQFYRLTSMEDLDAVRAEQKNRRGHGGERRENGEVHPGRDEDREGQAGGGADLQSVDSGDNETVSG